MIRNTSGTDALVAFLAELSIAVRDGNVASSTAEPFFSQLIKPTISILALPLLKPGDKTLKEPHWWAVNKDTADNGARKYKDRLGERISRLFCLCYTRGLHSEADSLLAWIKAEAEAAHIAVFPFVIIPLLGVLRSILIETGVSVSNEIQEPCVFITKKLDGRCIGPEPQKPVEWTRPCVECKDQTIAVRSVPS